jgi:hypothetical protein
LKPVLQKETTMSDEGKTVKNQDEATELNTEKLEKVAGGAASGEVNPYAVATPKFAPQPEPPVPPSPLGHDILSLPKS